MITCSYLGLEEPGVNFIPCSTLVSLVFRLDPSLVLSSSVFDYYSFILHGIRAAALVVEAFEPVCELSSTLRYLLVRERVSTAPSLLTCFLLYLHVFRTIEIVQLSSNRILASCSFLSKWRCP